MLLSIVGKVGAQRDVTSTYITNAKLDNGTTGWTVSNFNAPQRGNNTVGYATEAYAGWGSLDITTYSLTQNITLPAGNWRLVNYSFFRQGVSYNTNSAKSLAYLKAGAQQVAIKTLGSITATDYANLQTEGANCFDSKMYRNVVEFTTTGGNSTVEIGITGTFDEMRSWCIAGMFELFDMDDLASVSSPTDVTYAITNSGFEYRDATGWTSTNCGGYANNNNFGHKAGIGFVERWQASGNGGLSDGTFTQDLTGLENGLYELAVYAQNREQYNSDADGTGMYVKANSDRTEITSSGQHRVRTTVTDGNLTIGIQLDGCSGNWIAFDRFTLSFYGDPLQAFKDLLDEKVAEAQALHDGGTLRTGAANQLQTVIDANDNDDDAFTTEAEFNTAVSNIEAAMLLANNIAARYSVYETYRDKVTAWGNTSNYAYVDNGSPTTHKATFDAAITASNTAVANATSVAAVDAEIPNVRAAGLTFISNVTAEEGNPFDLTFLGSQVYTDWKKGNGSNAGIVADTYLTGRPGDVPSFAENFETTCATTGDVLYQEVTGLPVGYYRVAMYAQAMCTSGRDGYATDATENDANRTYAFAGLGSNVEEVQRVGLPIRFATSVPFEDLTPMDVEVHQTTAGTLRYGVTKDENGSNWHFAQFMGLYYSKDPDLTNLKVQRDALVAEAEGLQDNTGDLPSATRTALGTAITAGNNANTYSTLQTAVNTTLPNAINAANTTLTTVRTGRTSLLSALQRFEDNYNHYIINDALQGDGTDKGRLTMSTAAWSSLLTAVGNVSTDLGNIENYADYATHAAALVTQMDNTDTSIRLFKSYKAMVAGCQDLSIAEGTTYAADAHMATDAAETAAITALNTAFVAYQSGADGTIDMTQFTGGSNLDFTENVVGTWLANASTDGIKNLTGWDETYFNTTAAGWQIITNKNTDHTDQLYMRSNWLASGATSTLSVQKEGMLPEGDYTLTFDFKVGNALTWTTRIDNLCHYMLGNTEQVLGENATDWATETFSFHIDEPTTFDLRFGFTHKTANNSPAELYVRNVSLITRGGNPFQTAYDEAEALAATGNAAQAAIDQWTSYDGRAAELKAEDEDKYWKAVYILRNAKTIVENSGDATSLIANHGLINTTVTERTPYGWTKANEDGEGGEDVWVTTQNGDQTFNYWRATIRDIEFYQDLANLPAGTYRFSADLGSNGTPAALVAYIYGTPNPIGASQQCITLNGADNRQFGTYSAASEVSAVNNTARIGVRSGNFFQMKNIRFQYISDAAVAAAETDASYLRQDYYWSRGDNGREFDFTGDKYTNAQGVTLYPTGHNQIIKALSGQLTNTENVVVNGVCENLVITDGSPLSITSTTGEFEATTATYRRSMSNVWGTLILPFPVQAVSGQAFYTLRSVDEGEGTMGFNRIGDEIPANTPLAFRMTAGGDQLNIEMSNVDVELTTATQNDATTVADWEAEGTYSATTLDYGNDYYYIAQNKFWNASVKNVNVAPFRAWYHYTGSSPVKSFSIAFNDDWTDGIEPLNMDNGQGVMNETDFYDLQGRRVARPTKGIYVVEGRKVVIK